MISEAKENHEAEERKLRYSFPGEENIYLFDPTDDITVQELAEIMSIMPASILASINVIPLNTIDALIANLSSDSQRHFKQQKKSGLVLPQRVNGQG